MLNKKHILTCILAAGMLFALSACSNKTVSPNSVPATTSKSLGYQTTTTKSSNFKAPDFPDDIEHEPPQGEGFDITNEDIFEKGYYAFQFDSFSDAYIFWCKFRFNCTWIPLRPAYEIPVHLHAFPIQLHAIPLQTAWRFLLVL